MAPGKSPGFALALYDDGMTRNSVIFQCKKDNFQPYQLFPESLSRIAMVQEETSNSSCFFLELPEQLPSNNACLPSRYFRHSTSVFGHMLFLPHLAFK